ncbi:MAG: hypothetical protein ACPKPY_04385 [Nitrososphaeraceae archaeon]
MPSKGWRTVSLKEIRLNALKDIYEKDKKRPRIQDFGNWLDNVLYDFIEKNKYSANINPPLEVSGIVSNEIELIDRRDKTKKQIVTVVVEDNKMKCLNDNSSDCVHVGFCFSIPEVNNLLKI